MGFLGFSSGLLGFLGFFGICWDLLGFEGLTALKRPAQVISKGLYRNVNAYKGFYTIYFNVYNKYKFLQQCVGQQWK